VVITIDDGFRDNYDLAFPILKDFGLPATIFLTSGLLGTTKAPWIDEIGALLFATKSSYIDCPELFGAQKADLSTIAGKRTALKKIYTVMLSMEHGKKTALLHSLFKSLGNHGQGTAYPHRVMLDWDEIRTMMSYKIGFGAHTLSHPILSRMPYEEAVFEIVESKKMIEDKLGTRIRHFAIPNGRDEDFTEMLEEHCKSGLFESIATTNFGVVKENTNPFKLPRYGPPGPLYVFAADLARLFSFETWRNS
jgi:peptidoglycan/xylan/chitin deacetylase (PgdA/CDA1 family)